jgi:hypothetical protein
MRRKAKFLRGKKKEKVENRNPFTMHIMRLFNKCEENIELKSILYEYNDAIEKYGTYSKFSKLY